MKKLKKLFAIVFSLVTVLSIGLLSGCGKQTTADIIQTLNTMEINPDTAWQLSLTASESSVYGSLDGSESMSISVNGLTNINKSNPFENLKMDLDINVTQNEVVSSTVKNETNKVVMHVRADGEQLGVYTSEDGNVFTFESMPLSQLTGETVATDELNKALALFTEKGVLDNAIVTYGASSEKVKGNWEITIDYVQYAKAIIEQFETVLNEVESTSTVNDIYGKQAVKDLIDLHFAGVAAKEIYDEVVKYFEAQGAQVPAEIPAPQEGVSCYDYIQTVLNTEIEGVTIGSLPVGSEITAMKAQITAAIGQIKTQLDKITFKVKVIVKNNAFKGASLTYAQTISKMGELTFGTTNVSLNAEIKETGVNFVDVSTLTIEKNNN